MGMRGFGGDGANGLPKVIRRETAIAESGSEPMGHRRFARHRRTADKNDPWVTHAALGAKRAEEAHTGVSTQVRGTQREGSAAPGKNSEARAEG